MLSSPRRHNLQNPGCDHPGPQCGLEGNEGLPDGFGAAGGQVAQIDEATATDFDEGLSQVQLG